MSYTANAEHLGRVDTRGGFDSAKEAAEMLFVLMAANGWPGRRRPTVRDLAAGVPLSHRGVTYSVASQ